MWQKTPSSNLEPERWLLRILQETTSTGDYDFYPSSNNKFKNNLLTYHVGQLILLSAKKTCNVYLKPVFFSISIPLEPRFFIGLIFIQIFAYQKLALKYVILIENAFRLVISSTPDWEGCYGIFRKSR